jgi:hypothetical protein
MDREAAVIRTEMSQTRAELDRKIEVLKDRARDMAPRRVWDRHKPDYFVDRTVGGIVLVIGLKMVWNQLRARRRHRARVRAALESYGRW